MMSDNGHPNFSNYLNQSLKKLILSGLNRKKTYKMMVELEYMTSGLVGVICMWIGDVNRPGVGDVVSNLSDIHFYNVLKVLEEDSVV